MPNRRLTSSELKNADKLLKIIRATLKKFAADDSELLFALRRRLLVKLTHDERGTPAQRAKLKKLKRKTQNNICPLCSLKLPDKNAELDRMVASQGYTPENTRLVHHECHIEDQRKKEYK